MTDPVITRFAEACGATGPLNLRVDLADGGVLAEGSVPMPFSLVGRDDACDVTLADAEVNPRHAWLQVIGGRVYAVDLGSRTGLGWPGGTVGSGWMDPEVPVRVGPFQVSVRAPVSAKPAHFSSHYSPLQSDSAGVRAFPAVGLEFRNGRRAKDRWAVNRLITLVGRSPECKIHLTADDIASYHCGLVLTHDGLWVVDVSGRGVVVNGQRMRVSPLPHGAELWVGRFLIGVQYPAAGVAPPVGRAGVLAGPPASGVALDQSDLSSQSRQAAVPRGAKPAASPPEDEVPLGVVPPHDPAAGLPSSHIMADAFRLWSHPGNGGPVSNPILVSGSGPAPPSAPVAANPAPSRSTPPTATLPHLDLFAPAAAPSDPPPEATALLLRQLGDLQAQMYAHFRQSVALLIQLFGCLRRDQWPAVQGELARIEELSAELGRLQGEMVRRAAEVRLAPAPPRTPPPRTTPQRVTTATPTPLPDDARAPAVPDLHDWLMDRMNKLHQERQARWESLVGMFSGKTA